MKKILLSWCMLLLVGLGFAASDPLPQLENRSKSILKELSASRATLKSNPSVVEGIIRRELLPIIDRPTMARAVVGPQAWRSASKESRIAFIQEFTTLVIHTYASAMANYTNETIKFFPVRAAGNERVEIKSLIVRKEGPSIPVSYRLQKSGDQWRIYDFSVDGVSLVQSYRSQFAPHLKKGGLSALIQELKSHNHSKKNS